MVNTLTFVSDFPKYELDAIWPPGHPRYGESTQHMLQSGDWGWGGQPTCRKAGGIVNFYDPNVRFPSYLAVSNDPGDGGPVPTCTAWTFTADFTIVDWPPGPNLFVFLTVAGAGGGVRVGFNRAGNFFLQGQSTEHSYSTGLTYSGGPVTVHVEVDPGALWWVQIFVGAALARTYCGLTWGAGELYAATFGTTMAGTASPTIQLTTTAVSGQMGTRVGNAECPHPVLSGRARTSVQWWP
jgi:hypothetical protein